MAEGRAGPDTYRSRDASARIEQALAIQTDKGTAKDGIIPVPEHRDRRTLLDPEKIGHLDTEFFQRCPNAFGLFRPEPRGL